MTKAKEVNCILADVHCVNYPVITHSQPAAVRSLQPMMRESPEAIPHLVDAGLDSRPKRLRKFEKRCVETAVVDLEGAHAALTFSGPRTDTLRLFLLGLFQGGFKFGRELKFIFQKVIE